ncbi:adenylate/guanylate cyclase domain-containing protein [soil metagenome]
MPEERTARRLAAILASDVVGYSRMMGADEAGTLAALKRHREGVFDPAVALHNGRIVKLMGDGALVEFGSVVDAVNCALAVQKTAAGEAPTGAARITLRIGINLGDVIIDGDDLYGDGVNVAARLEPLAEPGGICVSSIVNESVGGRVSDAFRDGGEVQVKNIDRPIRVWKWSPGGAARSNGATVTPMAEPERRLPPSIAVLPFDNMSGDKEQEYFSDGITEDIITDLSRIGGLMVIARNSSFAYKGKSVDIRAVGRELGVRSVLEGSIRRAGNRVRITAQLIDAANGAHLWADRYDRDLTDVFAVQDEVTRRIVDALKVTLTPRERRLFDSSTVSGSSNAEAHDLALRAREILLRPTKNRDGFDRAVAFLKRAVELDPGFSQAYGGLAAAYNLDFHNRWTGTPDQSLITSMSYAELAIEKDPDDPFAHYVAGIIAGFMKNRERSKAELDRALELSPNYTLAINAKGVYEMYAGNAEAALALIERAMRLDPGFSQQYLHFFALTHLLLRRFETAAALFRERVLLVPETDLTRAFYASALGHLGRAAEAREVWRELMQINPRYSFDEHVGRLPFRPLDVDLIREGLTKAGLPK